MKGARSGVGMWSNRMIFLLLEESFEWKNSDSERAQAKDAPAKPPPTIATSASLTLSSNKKRVR